MLIKVDYRTSVHSLSTVLRMYTVAAAVHLCCYRHGIHVSYCVKALTWNVIRQLLPCFLNERVSVLLIPIDPGIENNISLRHI
jgi:hypothetical protein